MKTITVYPGRDKNGTPEKYEKLTMRCGEMYTIVGNTGAGKSRLIKDIEQLAAGDSPTGRRVELDGRSLDGEERQKASMELVAHLGQSMRFVLDISVGEFLELHGRCRGREVAVEQVLSLTNEMTAEPVRAQQNLNLISGGQARSLMIADVALVCDSPIVLADEIENAGIDKERALQALCGRDKLVLVVTHDPHTALMAPKRLVLENGGVAAVIERSPGEETLYEELSRQYKRSRQLQQMLRSGLELT